MKKLLFLAVLLLGSIAWGQTVHVDPVIGSSLEEAAVAMTMMQSSHSVTLTWTASTDAIGNPTLFYDVYRAPVACTATPTPTFSRVGSTAPLATTFTDTAVPLGVFCYVVTSLVNGAESVSSNTAPAVILPAAPTSVKATAN
jgi:hypothetical protein